MKTHVNRTLAVTLSAGVMLGAGVVLAAQQAVTTTRRVPQFENGDVKVWKSVVLPNAPLTMHRHEHPRVIIALSGGTMKIVDQTGATKRSMHGRRAKPIGYRRIRPIPCMRM